MSGWGRVQCQDHRGFFHTHVKYTDIIIIACRMKGHIREMLSNAAPLCHRLNIKPLFGDRCIYDERGGKMRSDSSGQYPHQTKMNTRVCPGCVRTKTGNHQKTGNVYQLSRRQSQIGGGQVHVKCSVTLHAYYPTVAGLISSLCAWDHKYSNGTSSRTKLLFRKQCNAADVSSSA